MPSQPPSSSLSRSAARLAIPLAAWWAIAAFARRDAVPSGAAEGAYLALLAAAVLLTVSEIAPWPAPELGIGALLASAVVWALPPGPARGTVFLVVLTATFLTAACRRLLGAESGEGLPFGAYAALALGSQFLLRGHLLFAPERTLKTLVALLVLPLLGAAAVALTARREGLGPTVTAAALSLLLAPGWNVSSTLGWVALAAAVSLARRESDRWERSVALAVLLAVVLKTPAPGLAAALCGLALVNPWVALPLAVAAALGLFPGMGFLHGLHSPLDTATQALWAVLAVPAILWPERQRWGRAAVALLLAAAVVPVPNLGVLAAPFALAGLAAGRRPAVAIPQRLWAGVLLGACALFASYPWLRPTPLAAALGLVGLAPGWMPLLALAGVLAALVLLDQLFFSRTGGDGRNARDGRPAVADLRGVAPAAVAIFLAVALQLPPPSRPLLTPEIPVLLDASRPIWQARPDDPRAASQIAVESSLANAATLSAGTPVAKVEWLGEGGRREEWTLRAGVDTGEWAAQRSDVRATGRLAARGAWVSWVSDGFFAQRYRCRYSTARPFRPLLIRIERDPRLPVEVSLALHQVEAGP